MIRMRLKGLSFNWDDGVEIVPVQNVAYRRFVARESLLLVGIVFRDSVNVFIPR
jgi:hypothetical protein